MVESGRVGKIQSLNRLLRSVVVVEEAVGEEADPQGQEEDPVLLV